ncbi:MAG: TolC family protein [Saprospiraceae bacterium]
MKKVISIAAFIFFRSAGLIAQPTILLESLYDALDLYHPYQKLKSSSEKIALEQRALNASTKLPQAVLSGQATWQSDVTSIPFTFPGIEIPTPTKDQYRALLDISQSIYDGGSHKSTEEQINQTRVMELANVDVSLYQLRETICRSYFGARVADLTIQQLQILIVDLEQKSKRLSTQIKEGIASGYQDAVSKVKIMEARQSIRDAGKMKWSAIQTINLLTGMHLDTTSRFDYVNGSLTGANSIRPEHELFNAQKKLQIALFDNGSSKYNPKFNAFAQLGYSRPGLNLLSKDFKPYSILGLRAQWNLSDLYLKQKDKEKGILQSNLDKIQTQEDAFDLLQKTKAAAQELDVKNYEASLKEDEEVISLYEKILISSAAQFENGISTINDYSNDANNLAQAKIKRDVHISLMNQAKELYNLIQGKR